MKGRAFECVNMEPIRNLESCRYGIFSLSLNLCTPGAFALKHEHFARLLAVNRATADVLFDELFDTDCNGLVDAFETM